MFFHVQKNKHLKEFIKVYKKKTKQLQNLLKEEETTKIQYFS